MKRVGAGNVFRIFFLLLAFTIHVSSYAQTSVRPLNGPKSERHVTDELGRRQGVWRYYYYYNGDIREEIIYVNNLMEGVNKKYYYGKKLQSECNYLGGRKDGDYKRYYLSGKIAVEGKYSFGKKDGQWITYYEEGQVKSEKEYNKGVKEGNWKIYNKKEIVISDVTYKNGVKILPALPPSNDLPIVNNKNPSKINNKTSSIQKPKGYKVTGGKMDTIKVK